MHRLVCLGLSHRTAPVELRERIGALGPSAERCPVVVEHATLQTCYRVELYAELSSGVEDARDELIDALSGTPRRRARAPDGPPVRPLGDDAVRHLCRAAAGLTRLYSVNPRSSARWATPSNRGRLRGRLAPVSRFSSVPRSPRPQRAGGDGDRGEPGVGEPRWRWPLPREYSGIYARSYALGPRGWPDRAADAQGSPGS